MAFILVKPQPVLFYVCFIGVEVSLGFLNLENRISPGGFFP